MATKNTPKAPVDPAAAPTPDATAPDPDTTEANNADRPEQLPETTTADQAATEPAADGAAEPALPTKIRLTCPFGFYADDGQLSMWHAGQEITDPDEIQILLNAGAEHEDLE